MTQPSFDLEHRDICQHGRAIEDDCPFCNPLSTSHTRAAADEEIKPAKAHLREWVYATIRDNPGITDERIAEITHLNPSTARPRRLELERAGGIEAAGKSTTRSGRKAIGWRVVGP